MSDKFTAPLGYKIATIEQRDNNPYPDGGPVLYATNNHSWTESYDSSCWTGNHDVQFAVPESYQFPNDKPTAPDGFKIVTIEPSIQAESEPTPKTCTINLRQRALLFDWCREHKDDPGTFKELAVVATRVCMFPITRAVLKNHWAAVNGKRRVAVTGGTMIGRIDALEARMTKIEIRLHRDLNLF